jgi:hypothetical protein
LYFFFFRKKKQKALFRSAEGKSAPSIPEAYPQRINSSGGIGKEAKSGLHSTNGSTLTEQLKPI